MDTEDERQPRDTGSCGVSQIASHEDGQSGHVRLWDTDLVREKERFAYFREGVCQAFLSFSPIDPIQQSFCAKIEQHILPSGSVSKIDVTPHFALRTKEDFAKIHNEYLSLNIHLGGGCELELDGRSSYHKKGDMTLLEGTQIKSVNLDADSNFEVISLIFDRSKLANVAKLHPRSNTILPKSRQWQPLRTILSVIADRFETASLRERTHLMDASLSLLLVGLIGDEEALNDQCGPGSSALLGIDGMVREIIKRNLSDPDLSLPFIANQLGVSVRYIQKVFEQNDETVKAYITSLRIEAVARELVEPKYSGLSISDIAFRWGFRDMTTFHRNFKNRVQRTPDNWRRSGV